MASRETMGESRVTRLSPRLGYVQSWALTHPSGLRIYYPSLLLIQSSIPLCTNKIVYHLLLCREFCIYPSQLRAESTLGSGSAFHRHELNIWLSCRERPVRILPPHKAHHHRGVCIGPFLQPSYRIPPLDNAGLHREPHIDQSLEHSLSIHPPRSVCRPRELCIYPSSRPAWSNLFLHNELRHREMHISDSHH
jgi:hypothetical protein